jgi:hypothetical protein
MVGRLPTVGLHVEVKRLAMSARNVPNNLIKINSKVLNLNTTNLCTEPGHEAVRAKASHLLRSAQDTCNPLTLEDTSQ